MHREYFNYCFNHYIMWAIYINKIFNSDYNSFANAHLVCLMQWLYKYEFITRIEYGTDWYNTIYSLWKKRYPFLCNIFITRLIGCVFYTHLRVRYLRLAYIITPIPVFNARGLSRCVDREMRKMNRILSKKFKN